MKKILIGSMLLVLTLTLAACGGNKTSADGGEVFEYGAQTYSDPKIMGHIVKLLVEDQTDHEVEVTEDIQASPQILGALDKGEFDFATLYSGEVYNNHFDEDKVEFSTDPDKTMEQAQKLFGDKYNVKWYDTTGFTNQYSIAVKQDFADENNIETLTELGVYAPDMKVGADSAWKERANDGYRDFVKAYGYEFGDVNGMEISLMYEGIAGGELDAITAYTVDPHILENDLVVLEDDKNFFAPYQGSIVAKNEVLDEYPEVKEVLDSIVGLVSTDEMTELIREVDINERKIPEVAKEFLQEKDMLD
ncbi:Choline-binding protein [Lentibacillus sp. JNUCC-1]|uniref:ABC transporter substrate-binding protein n=1 Tax=Lentibacillus sp. JNUCC-1 TaxID=2654513 RepID=UPI0012E89B03|nr:glycine betaine ABC transporter substrate-binding protein [Lentibacillus sp. JNUCC-1]MUV37819.1 Choline-binding protein [Lentibacillus sp. JNUCC-1]